MSKHTKELFCYSCDQDFKVSFNDENTKLDPTYCPFCGDEIETEESDIIADDNDEEMDNNWA